MKIRAPFNLEAYRQWRSTVPFSDKQIAGVLDSLRDVAIGNDDWFRATRYTVLAIKTRKGFLASHTLSLVLPFLITTCALCPKTALYFAGCSGRCSNHRMVPDSFAEQRKQRLEAKSGYYADEERQLKIRDQAAKFAKMFRQSRKGVKS